MRPTPLRRGLGAAVALALAAAATAGELPVTVGLDALLDLPDLDP